MKKYLFIIAAVAAVCSCTKEPIAQKDSQEKEYTIGIMPVGDISASYSPLTKTDSEETIWYGINVKCDGSDYLFGVYDDISKFNVQLSTSHSYSFEVTAVKGADEDLVSIECRNNPVSTYYCYELRFPFYFDVLDRRQNYMKIANYAPYYELTAYGGVNTGIKAPNYLNILHDKGAVYQSFEIATGASSYSPDYDVFWVTYLNNVSKGDNSNEWYRFYGTKSNFTPSKDETLPFSLKHEGFGLQYSVSGICDGSVSVVIDNAQEEAVTYFSQPAITTDYTSPQKVFEFRDMTSETEQVKVTVVWTRGNNVVDNLGSTTVNVRRNKVNKINITLGEHSNGEALSISTDASDYFGNENKNITI